MAHANWLTQDRQHLFDAQSSLYAKGRPEHDQKVIEGMLHTLPLDKNSVIVDIGAGPAVLPEKWAREYGLRTIAVEPGDGMRRAAIKRISKNPRWAAPLAIMGSTEEGTGARAEKTNLPDNYADLVTICNAAHWIVPNLEEALPEIGRILKPGGSISVIYTILDQTEPFTSELNQIFENLCPDYDECPAHFKRVGERDPNYIGSLFVEENSHKQRLHTINNVKFDDFEHFMKMLESYSFFPKDQKIAEAIEKQAEELYKRYQEPDGSLITKWQTTACFGRLKGHTKILEEHQKAQSSLQERGVSTSTALALYDPKLAEGNLEGGAIQLAVADPVSR